MNCPKLWVCFMAHAIICIHGNSSWGDIKLLGCGCIFCLNRQIPSAFLVCFYCHWTELEDPWLTHGRQFKRLTLWYKMRRNGEKIVFTVIKWFISRHLWRYALKCFYDTVSITICRLWATFTTITINNSWKVWLWCINSVWYSVPQG